MRSARLASLGTPAFVAALALLVLNDFALKPLLHNAVTGKLSDFAGLFALTLFVSVLWPSRRRLAACAIAAAFAWWKSSHADPAIEWLNAWLPFAVGRTVDLTDLVALPMIPLAAWAAPRLKAWPLPRTLQLALAVAAPVAFTATSRIPYMVRGTADLTAAAVVEEDLQRFFDELAGERGFRCYACGPIGDGRGYVRTPDGARRAIDGFTVELDAASRTLTFVVRDYERERAVRRFLADIVAALQQRFPDVAVVERTDAGKVRRLPEESTIFAIRPRGAAAGESTPDETERRLLELLDALAAEHGLERDPRAQVYGRRASQPSWLEWPLLVAVQRGEPLVVRVESWTPELAAPQGAIANDLEQRLQSAFGAANVTRHVPPNPWY